MTWTPDPQHVTAEQLAAYLERRLPSIERDAVERHLARCPECRRDLTGAGRMLHSYRRPVRRAAAAGAIGIAALVLLVIRAGDGRPPPDSSIVLPDSYRSAGEPATTGELVVISPAPNMVVSPADQLMFAWRGTQPGRLHRLVLADAAGRTVWTIETPDSTAALPETVTLELGATYIWYVDALGDDGNSAGTGPVSFTTR